MKLTLLEEVIQLYKKRLRKRNEDRSFLVWECLQNFQKYWDIQSETFISMYDQSLESSLSRSLWKKSNYDPKGVMLLFAELDQSFVRNMFSDLLDGSKSLGGRIDRFVFYCDQLLEAYRQNHPLSPINSHFHSDYHMISLYLAFVFPQQYCLYDFNSFQLFLQRLESPKPYLVHDLERYQKVMRLVQQYIEKDKELTALLASKIRRPIFYQGPSLVPAYDLCTSIGDLSV